MVNKNLIYTIIVWKICIIMYVSCYWLFLIPPPRININMNISQTYAGLENTLCLKTNNGKKAAPSSECPHNGIVTVVQGGRLGNQIWEYASVWVVAKETGLKPYVPKCIKSRIEILFENLSIPTIEEIRQCPMDDNFSIRYMKSYDQASKKSIILPKYNTQPELLGKYFQNMSEEFKIKQNLLNESQKILHSIRKLSKRTVLDAFIGIHIRRTDYVKVVANSYHKKTADMNFYKAAIGYFQKKYKNSIFIVVTDEPAWCKKMFKSVQDVYIASSPKSSPELDMAILASCNHSIIDYGTFGQWGALLAGGETIFFGINQKYSSEKLSKVLPRWHTL